MDWNEVKSKPKRATKPKRNEDDEGHWGGASHGHLMAGAVQKTGMGKASISNQASNIADYDYLRDGDEEIKYETISHDCAAAVQAARMAKDISQVELAKLVNEKPGTINEIENGTAKYNADVINRIERVLGVKIPRGRKAKKPAKKTHMF